MGVTNKLKSVLSVDKHVLWILLVLSICIPLIRPLGLPVTVTAMTQEFYDTIEKLPPGAKVWVEDAIQPQNMAELLPGIIAGMTHLMKKNLKIVIGTTSDPTAIGVYTEFILPALQGRGVLTKYGVDWVRLPFIPGGETGLAAEAANIRSTTPVDFYGTPLDRLPVMQGLNSVKDFDLVIMFGMSGTFFAYIRQVQAPYKVKFICDELTIDIPAIMSYYPAQVSAIMKGLGGAAEYEKLIGYPGSATKYTEGLSLSYVILLLAVIAANVYYVTNKHRRKK
jgi:hypothetical protein